MQDMARWLTSRDRADEPMHRQIHDDDLPPEPR
jgi:hypothetical protein